MNPRKVCAVVLTMAGLTGLSIQPASAGRMPVSVIEEVRLQGELALMRIEAEQRYAARENSREVLANLCILNEEPFQVAAAEIRMQGQFALWSIQESQLAAFRSGSNARGLAVEHENRNVVATANGPEDFRLKKAGELIKSTRLDLPQFLPAILR